MHLVMSAKEQPFWWDPIASMWQSRRYEGILTWLVTVYSGRPPAVSLMMLSLSDFYHHLDLRQWHLNKMDKILQTFQMHLLEWKWWYFDSNVSKGCSWGSYWQINHCWFMKVSSHYLTQLWNNLLMHIYIYICITRHQWVNFNNPIKM